MKIKEIDFKGSFPRVSSSPKQLLPEYAFIGRSNVGKSSLINKLLGRKNLARVSGKPGKTQLLNYYEINKNWVICDLPGYGYAKISKKHRLSLEKIVNGYLMTREQLQCAFVLIDANIPAQKIDIEFMNWLGANRVPFIILFTKTDRKGPKVTADNIDAIKATLLETWEVLPQTINTSALDGTGTDELLELIATVNKSYFAHTSA